MRVMCKQGSLRLTVMGPMIKVNQFLERTSVSPDRRRGHGLPLDEADVERDVARPPDHVHLGPSGLRRRNPLQGLSTDQGRGLSGFKFTRP